MKKPDSPHGRDISRRTMLGLLGLGGAAGIAALLGCEPKIDFPDGVLGGSSLDRGYAPPTPHGPLGAAPAAQQANSYGILPRSAWAKAGPNMATVAPMNGVKMITFHHSGDPKVFTTTDYSETAQHLEYVREYHRSRGFKDIGYHFAIDRAGRVWQLRSLSYQGEHVRNNNEHNIGVVVLGNFDLQAMSQAQKDKVRAVSQLIRKQYALPISKVYTHQEIVKTECPGDNMQPYMVQVRKQGLI